MTTRAKVASSKSKNVADLPSAWASEQTAVEYMERQRWGDSPACPKCGVTDVYQMREAKTGQRSKRFLWRCRGCKQQYTVRVGTIMEDSAIPLQHWCFAFAAACASKKGVSAKQIQRMTGVSYKSALFMMHRIRWAMGGNSQRGKLDGIVEVDETYVGGKPRKKTLRDKAWRGPEKTYKFRPGRGADFEDRKTPVVAMVQRNGDVRAMVMPRVTAKTLADAIHENIDPSTRLMTDESQSYLRAGRKMASHETVAHGRGEYARGDVCTNTVEGFFAILKRGVYGTFHSVSKKHLHRYVSEFEFRYNHRHMEDGQRLMLGDPGCRRSAAHLQAAGHQHLKAPVPPIRGGTWADRGGDVPVGRA
jgi:transposase-like protein